VLELVRRNPSEAADVTLELVNACETDEQLAYVAAGPIEDLLWGSPQLVFPIFARACATSPKLCRAMSMLALEESDEVFSKWKALLQERGLCGAK
jgi:hypothetical protein